MKNVLVVMLWVLSVLFLLTLGEQVLKWDTGNFISTAFSTAIRAMLALVGAMAISQQETEKSMSLHAASLLTPRLEEIADICFEATSRRLEWETRNSLGKKFRRLAPLVWSSDEGIADYLYFLIANDDDLKMVGEEHLRSALPKAREAIMRHLPGISRATPMEALNQELHAIIASAKETIDWIHEIKEENYREQAEYWEQLQREHEEADMKESPIGDGKTP